MEITVNHESNRIWGVSQHQWAFQMDWNIRSQSSQLAPRVSPGLGCYT